MEKKSMVRVISKLTAVSSRPVGPVKSHPLTVLDHAMELHTIHIILYYKDSLFGSFDLNPFRVSLSEALSLYPVVTGRLTRGEDGNWVVKCNDAGVRVVRAKVETTLDEWLRSADWFAERDLTVREEMPQDPINWSPFQIQISEFEGGGVAIGLSCIHINADPTSLANFLKSWSDVDNRKVVGNPPVFTASVFAGDRKPSLDTKTASFYEEKAKAEGESEKMASATFKFSNSKMEEALSKCPNATPFDYLCALFWARIAGIKRSKDEQKVSLSISTDSRSSLQPHLSTSYFGNALHFSQLSMDSKELAGAELDRVMEAVRRHVTEQKEEEIRGGIDWLESRREESGKFGAGFRMYGPELTCVSLEHLIYEDKEEGEFKSLAYDAVFGENFRPIHISYSFGNAEGKGLFVISPSPENGFGRTVSVMLPEKELSRLYDDEAILNLDPEILLRSCILYH